MKLIESVVDLIELGAIQPQDIVKNLRSALAQTKPLDEVEQGDAVCQEDDGCPTEMAVLKRFWRSHQTKSAGFSTIQEVISKHEAIPSRKEAIDKAREWLKDYPIEAIFVEPFTKPLSDEEIIKIRQATKATTAENWADTLAFARAIEERHGIK